MPKWTALKEKCGDKDICESEQSKHGIQYSDGSHCIIGEAHGFSGDTSYGGCEKCNAYSYGTTFNFKSVKLEGKTAGQAKYGSVRDFYKFKENVYNHFLESHPEKLLL